VRRPGRIRQSGQVTAASSAPSTQRCKAPSSAAVPCTSRLSNRRTPRWRRRCGRSWSWPWAPCGLGLRTLCHSTVARSAGLPDQVVREPAAGQRCPASCPPPSRRVPGALLPERPAPDSAIRRFSRGPGLLHSV